ncbi:hypothetical protein [Psychrobacillus soli]|uniref:Polysaccharide deacetylase family protein n=1 Tax=Psychrobacillus soli TaxID=1543965 RepID=A0A544TIB0_9BACI|nr:hypothetical protein [Psychrobacillus soli]TQR17195.1 hypothetical protein FG383_05390 [Psychrobacillus soli]
MKKKLLLVGSLTLLITLLFNVPRNYPSILPVFQLTEKPTVISKGTYGKTVTIDLTFGKDEIETLLKDLKAPYPHFFISTEWMERSEPIIKIMQEKHIPIGLLGKDGANYIEDPVLFQKEVDQFEKVMGEKPLWFRTKDYQFPIEVQEVAWQQEVNLLSSSKYWDVEIPKLTKGDVLSVPLHQDERVDIKQLTKLLGSETFLPIEQNIFGLKMNTKTFPE